MNNTRKNGVGDINFNKFKNKYKLADELAERLKVELEVALNKKKKVWIVVSGGNTPIDLFERLSNKNIDWKRVYITLTDERCVPLDSPDSNEGLVRNYLLKNRASEANFVSLRTKKKSTNNFSSNDINTIEEIDDIDVLVLGMGEDGHTASFFEQDPNLIDILSVDNNEACSKVTLDKENIKRITLNYSVLSKAVETYLHIVGNNKLIALKRAMEVNEPLRMPISIFLQRPINIFWSE